MPAHIPAWIMSAVREERNRAGHLFRSQIIELFLVVLQRRGEEMADHDRFGVRPPQVIGKPVTGVQANRSPRERQDAPACPRPHGCPPGALFSAMSACSLSSSRKSSNV